MSRKIKEETETNDNNFLPTNNSDGQTHKHPPTPKPTHITSLPLTLSLQPLHFIWISTNESLRVKQKVFIVLDFPGDADRSQRANANMQRTAGRRNERETPLRRGYGKGQV